MNALMQSRSLQELKITYRKLVSTHHPDRGGNVVTMQKINESYQNMIKRFKAAAKSTHKQTKNFSNVAVGDTIYVNGTECQVTSVSPREFCVMAKDSRRQARFNKVTGVGTTNSRLRASFG